jgi:hypothetical protein
MTVYLAPSDPISMLTNSTTASPTEAMAANFDPCKRKAGVSLGDLEF